MPDATVQTETFRCKFCFRFQTSIDIEEALKFQQESEEFSKLKIQVNYVGIFKRNRNRN